MIIGVMSDTHDIEDRVIENIVADLTKRGAEMIFHCGDIEKPHFRADLFGNLPVICALVPDQCKDPKLLFSPSNWAITKPGDRIVNLGLFQVYVGHRRAFDFMRESEAKMEEILAIVTKDYDRLRYVCAGHTHHQIFIANNTLRFINPGAVANGYDGYEYALINTENQEVVFTRIPLRPQTDSPFTIGVISDTKNISKRDPDFWRRLTQEFHKRDVSVVIHCGNLWSGDFGRPEFSPFQVYFYRLPDQEAPSDLPVNWHMLDKENPIIEIRNHYLLVDYFLGLSLYDKSEYGTCVAIRELLAKHRQIDFVLCGMSDNAILEEEPRVKIINPGDVFQQDRFAVICLPRAEITFSTVPFN